MFFKKKNVDDLTVMTEHKSYSLKLKKTYLIKEVKPTLGFRLFVESINVGYKGLCISRMNPKTVISRYKMEDYPILWLSEMDTDKSVEPTELEQLSYTILKYINENEQSIVLLDGLIYLINHNSFNTVLRFIQNIKDEVSIKKATMIVTLNPNALSEQELSILESELDWLE